MDAGSIAWGVLATLYVLTLALGGRWLLSLRADTARVQASLTRLDTAPQQVALPPPPAPSPDDARAQHTIRTLESKLIDTQSALTREQQSGLQTSIQYIKLSEELQANQTHIVALETSARARADGLSQSEAALNQRIRDLEAAASLLTADKTALSQKVTHLQASLANVQRATQAADKAQATESARLQQHREAALNQRIRELEATLQEAHNRAAIAEALQGSSAQLQQHIQDLKTKLQLQQHRERAILKAMNEETDALNETVKRTYARGLIEGVCIDGLISPTEKARVDVWFANNGLPHEWAAGLFHEMQAQYEAQWLISDDPRFDLSVVDAPTSPSAHDLQQLQDMIAAAAADGVISYEELQMLCRWSSDRDISPSTLKQFLNVARLALANKLIIQSSAQALSNQEKGEAFERHVVNLFNAKYFKLIEWRSDKTSANGRYALSAMQPDLELELRAQSQRHRLAVECKWRSNLNAQGEVEWCRERQLERYRAFADERQVPVFLILGLGGMPQEPHSVFVIPLYDIAACSLPRDLLNSYKRPKPQQNLFFNPKDLTLR